MKYLSKILIIMFFVMVSMDAIGEFIYGTYSLKYDLLDSEGEYIKIKKGRYEAVAEDVQTLSFVRRDKVTPMTLFGSVYNMDNETGFYRVEDVSGDEILLEPPIAGDNDTIAIYRLSTEQDISFSYREYQDVNSVDYAEVEIRPKSIVVEEQGNGEEGKKIFKIYLESEITFNMKDNSDFQDGQDVFSITDRVARLQNSESIINLRALEIRSYYGEQVGGWSDKEIEIAIQISLDNRKSEIEMIDNESRYSMDFGIGIEGDYLDTASEYGSSAEIVVVSAKEAILALEMKDKDSAESNIVNLEKDGVEIKCDISPEFEGGASLWRDSNDGDPRSLFYLTGDVASDANLEDRGKGKIVINGRSQVPISDEPGGTYSGVIEVTVSYED